MFGHYECVEPEDSKFLSTLFMNLELVWFCFIYTFELGRSLG